MIYTPSTKTELTVMVENLLGVAKDGVISADNLLSSSKRETAYRKAEVYIKIADTLLGLIKETK